METPETENSDLNSPPTPIFQQELNTTLSAGFLEGPREQTQLRLRYEAESRVIRSKIGDLESIRSKLGLSRRKMCQALLVDPSAWTRWTKNPDKVPPHIYRSLQWYMALIDKNPEWHPQNSYLKLEMAAQSEEFNSVRERVLKRLAEISHLETDLKADIERVVSDAKGEVQSLQSSLERQTGSQMGWKVLLIINTVLLLYYIFRSH